MSETVMIPMQTIILTREDGMKPDGKTPKFKKVIPPVGKPFAFTEEEIDSVLELEPNALRSPVNEDESQEVDEAESKARRTGGAAGDAANVARANVKKKSKAKKGGSSIETTPDDDEAKDEGQDEAPESDEEESL